MTNSTMVTSGKTSNIDQLDVGVIGVGSMGANHARVYRQLSDARLAGVSDLDTDRADNVASDNGVMAMQLDDLLTSVDAVSVAVPTKHHYEITKRCLDAGVHVMVEKPFVDDLDDGQELDRMARRAGLTLQVGHIERFNPAVIAALDIVDGMDLIAVDARRVGPPVDRSISDDVILDLMIHDLDVVLAMMGEKPIAVDAFASREGQHATTLLPFPEETVVSLTASRVTQRRRRTLEITTEECQIEVDYLDQSVYIHRQSHPEYTSDEGNLRYRNESIVEQPMVERGEPLKNELSSFLEAIKTDSTPVVTATDGLRVLEVANTVEATATGHPVSKRVEL